MTMVVSRKQRIFFRYEGERGAFLVLHHGLLGSQADWYAAGYVEALAKEFRVVVPDARGHGRSDKPAGKEHYALRQLAEDVVEILNELGIRNSHFVGYGLGALVGLELLRHFPERMRIAILGGESPLVTPAVQAVYRAEADSLRPISLGEYLKALRDQGRVVRTAEAVDEELERPAALALLEALSEWELAPAERIQVLSPLTLFSGSEDPAAPRVEAARSGVSRARHVLYSGMGHARLFHERTQLMAEVLRLLKSGRREDGTEGRPHGEGGTAAGQGGTAAGQGGTAAGQGGTAGGESGQGSLSGERRRAPARRDGSRPATRWSDRGGAGDRGPVASQPAAEAPSPIPGAVLDLRSPPPAPERPAGEEPDTLAAGPAPTEQSAESGTGDRAAGEAQPGEPQGRAPEPAEPAASADTASTAGEPQPAPEPPPRNELPKA
jgi:pimeloyl-ACP methyl ester carboxylesterase